MPHANLVLMSDAAPRLATYDDLLALPEDVRAEILDGQIVTAPSPLPEHNWATDALTHLISWPFSHGHGRGGPGGWWIISEVDVQLTANSVVRPDLAGWRRERLAEPSWGTRPIRVIPDWICEVLSPSNAAHDRVTKADLYSSQGVGYLWLVNPAERVLEAFKLTDGLWLRIGSYRDAATVRIPPFDGIEFDVGLLFPPLSDD